MMMITGALMRRLLAPWLQRSLLMNALTENFYILMPPTRIHQPVRLRNPPTSFMLKDISTYVQDDADKGAIALQAYCPPFDDNDGKFWLTFQNEELQIYVFAFNKTITFTESHTVKKYCNLVPGPPSPTMWCGYSFWCIGVYFYILMPPTKIYQSVCLKDPPSSILLKDIQSYVDNAGVRVFIMKALKTHCPPFKDYDGKFLRSCVQKDLQIYIFTFKTTATFTECHTNKKYHALVPGSPSPTIVVPPFLRLPFHPWEFWT